MLTKRWLIAGTAVGLPAAAAARACLDDWICAKFVDAYVAYCRGAGNGGVQLVGSTIAGPGDGGQKAAWRYYCGDAAKGAGAGELGAARACTRRSEASLVRT